MTAEGHCNIVWGGDFKDTLRFQTSNFSFSFDATFRFADYRRHDGEPRNGIFLSEVAYCYRASGSWWQQCHTDIQPSREARECQPTTSPCWFLHCQWKEGLSKRETLTLSGEMLTNLSLVLVTHLSVSINSKFSFVLGRNLDDYTDKKVTMIQKKINHRNSILKHSKRVL